MPEQYICEGDKFVIGGSKSDVIALPIFIAGLPEKIEIEGHLLLRRGEFHVSLVCIGEIVRKHDVVIPDFLNKVVADFCKFAQGNKIDLVRYRNEFRLAAKDEEKTIVVMCDISNLNKFFDFINEKYNLKVGYQTTHITLYTLDGERGIFLTDQNDIQKLTKIIKKPDGINL